MTVSKPQVLDVLRRIKGPDLEGNIVDLGLVSEILVKDDRVYFSITVPVARAEELEPLRKAAESVVAKVPGVSGVTAVLTAEAARGTAAGVSARTSKYWVSPLHSRFCVTCANRPRENSIVTSATASVSPSRTPQVETLADTDRGFSPNSAMRKSTRWTPAS